jgi:hypothetical protein
VRAGKPKLIVGVSGLASVVAGSDISSRVQLKVANGGQALPK